MTHAPPGATALPEDPLAGIRIVPVVVIDDAGKAPELVDALLAGGIRAVEITLRTPAGLPAIAAAARNAGIVVGAGTVLTPDQVDQCVDAGARFIVSPGLDEDVVRRARQRGVFALPGVATPTEVQRALALGLHRLKFFPADRLGGLDTLRSLRAVFPQVRFMPSGGVNPDNARAYLDDPAVFAISGSWMVPHAWIAAGDFSSITEASRAAMAL